jgi:hypothetical protein
MDLEINATITGTVEGVSYDCDLVESGTAVYQTPAAAP